MVLLIFLFWAITCRIPSMRISKSLTPRFFRCNFEALIGFIFIGALSACTPTPIFSVVPQVLQTIQIVAAPSPSPQAPAPVCDPFSSVIVVGKYNGIKASLKYIPNGSATYPTDIASFNAMGTPHQSPIFLNQLNIPTESFTLGFPTLDGSLLTDGTSTLNEWFMLQMDAKIHLPAWESPGMRQFALLSDDGSILQLDQGQGLQPFLNNDGTHGSNLACSSTAVWLDSSRDIPMHLDYYQGPRAHIALVLLWRLIPDAPGNGPTDSPLTVPSAMSSAACTRGGSNNAYFDPDNGSAPTPLWNNFLSQGWEVMPASAFMLEGYNVINPCWIGP
jgi:hypothetical protein